MRNMRKRIARLAVKAEAMQEQAADRKAKLQRLEQLKIDSPVAALLLQKELETGRNYTLAMLFAELSEKRRSAVMETG